MHTFILHAPARHAAAVPPPFIPSVFIMFKLGARILCLGFCLTASAQSLAPFGADVKALPKQVVRPIGVKPQVIDCLSASNASAWNVENPPEGSAEKLF